MRTDIGEGGIDGEIEDREGGGGGLEKVREDQYVDHGDDRDEMR